ncbi:MAG: Alanine--tRNA ligase [Chlamydiales bacterium]|nr:Alanine--tRNA ligase [Chlamydiales bacterium]MCH9619847.1 Alanine--tRNA ligase [Chlamydiales bacterium]MCH9622726.1 Alanine--tRNA ligase [Chlamydiales bacterium]
MISQDIRKKFLQYFEKKKHVIVPSSSVIPHDDPSLLFINAGMNQFKDVFLGQTVRDYTKATSTQKCVRVGGKHNDLENVGHTDRHLTFFEMLGNFSFGDYFKKEANAFAWEVTCEVFGFDTDKIWVSVFHDDEESFELWKEIVPEKRIVRMGEKDNFWAMGDVGPCGPCAELYYDKGESFGSARSPAEDIEGTRFLEFWNLVFMQYNRDGSGNLNPLTKTGVDTGAGLERVASIKMGVDSLFETDVLRALIMRLEVIARKPYKSNPAFHVVADHLRTLCFAIADGVQPSNIERGYVLRKVLRRAVRYGRQLGLDRPFLGEMFPTLLEMMGADFPELKASENRICEILMNEEEAFLRTLKRGGNLLNQIVEHSKGQICGEDAFKLKDTYGLPLEEILLLAKDVNLGVDINRFEELEHDAKNRSRGARKVTEQVASESVYEGYVQTHGDCSFLGYKQLTSEAVVLGLMREGKLVSSLSRGEEGTVLLDQTPFYAEMGGQVGDQGSLSTEDLLFEVTNTSSPYATVISHHGVVKKGDVKVGDRLTATVDDKRRQKIANNHTATHLLHWALGQKLGPHIKQAGSIVEPTRLRFDFNHHKALTDEEIKEIESLVNGKIRENLPVLSYELTFAEAQKKKEIQQIFGEKYGTMVRVVDIDFSKELCGGTHTTAVGTIGYFRIAKEGSISAGVRRIEAVTGSDAEIWVEEEASKLKARIDTLLEENRVHQKNAQKAKSQALLSYVEKLAKTSQQIGSVPFIGVKLSLSPKELKELADLLLEKVDEGVLLLLSSFEGKCAMVARISPKCGISAGALIKEIAPIVGGKGGGKPDFAQGGGTKPEQIENALEHARKWIASNAS